jgi:hypothetical protein
MKRADGTGRLHHVDVHEAIAFLGQRRQVHG